MSRSSASENVHPIQASPPRGSFETVASLIEHNALRCQFQPIVSLSDGVILGHEALIRGPVGSSLEYPDALFAKSETEGLEFELEIHCVATILDEAARALPDGRLFVNLSAHALRRLLEEGGEDTLLRMAAQSGFPLTNLVIELTEHERVVDTGEVVAKANSLRARGVTFAIDDFGDGRSSLRLWAELGPEWVKIDKFFTFGLSDHPYKVQTLMTIVHMAETLGGRLIAEGIETGHALALVRDLGIPFGQGYFLGRPADAPLRELAGIARENIQKGEIAVARHTHVRHDYAFSAEKLLINIAPVLASATTQDVLDIFRANPSYQSLAVVDGGVPVGLINRRVLMDRYAQPFQKELFGKRSCMAFADASPQILDRTATIEEMVKVLTSADQRYLTDGLIITDAGKYAGLATGEQLVRTVTEHRVEAARHANPLTNLPGNIPITEHIEKLLASGNSFVACYCDLNHFKPFNDQFGYWKGDEMIRMLASIVVAHAASTRDFVGHVGGDDLIVLFQSEDWKAKCEEIVREFNESARGLFDAEALARGGIEAEDRSGQPSFFPLTTLSIGALIVAPGTYSDAAAVASAAAAAKRQAKRNQSGLFVAA